MPASTASYNNVCLLVAQVPVELRQCSGIHRIVGNIFHVKCLYMFYAIDRVGHAVYNDVAHHHIADRQAFIATQFVDSFG